MEKDQVLQCVMGDVEKGHMGKLTAASEYGKVFGELMILDGLILRGETLVVPPKLRADMIALAHETHGLGVSRMVRLLRERVWFPRLASMTKEYIGSCLPCSAAVGDNPPAPIIMQEMVEIPWQVLAADYKGPIGGTNGYYIHVLVDCYSRYPEIAMMKSTSFEKLKPKLDKIWARHGVPDTITHDGGPPYTSHEWLRYAEQVGFRSSRCTPEHPQANGMAERMMASLVKVTHAALAEKADPKAAVHKYMAFVRATPHSSTATAPSELLMGRRLKLKIPGLLGKFDT